MIDAEDLKTLKRMYGESQIATAQARAALTAFEAKLTEILVRAGAPGRAVCLDCGAILKPGEQCKC